MCASSQRSPDAVAVLSYMMESATYYNEASVHASVDAGRARFVYLVSLVLDALVALCIAVA